MALVWPVRQCSSSPDAGLRYQRIKNRVWAFHASIAGPCNIAMQQATFIFIFVRYFL